ncbi:hypothetical protein ACVWYG_001488 [Pedobacter sp. UYEF25]
MANFSTCDKHGLALFEKGEKNTFLEHMLITHLLLLGYWCGFLQLGTGQKNV